jgi:hypothetical protein
MPKETEKEEAERTRIWLEERQFFPYIAFEIYEKLGREATNEETQLVMLGVTRLVAFLVSKGAFPCPFNQ